ncbi:MAG: enoyl-CoA hydratase-related protein [Dehalococcoidia bacterium]|nr:enoyl-CoA hydratase-related protein [Dehalococcoidia bacterium]
MSWDYTEALLTVEERIATLTLNRPEKLNAFTPKMEDDIRAAIKEINSREDIGVVVVTGAGRGFSSGADVVAWDAGLESGEQQESDAITSWRRNEARHSMPLGLHELRQPVIAAVNGAAVGMGMDFALGADMRVAGESAKFGMFYIKRGMVPDEGGAWFLPRLVGAAKAFEIILTGELFDGREAERIGLVNYCVPDAELMDKTMELAEKIAAGPPMAVELAKRAIRESANVDLRNHFDAIGYYMSLIGRTGDVAEGMRAFMERREPNFTSR